MAFEAQKSSGRGMLWAGTVRLGWSHSKLFDVIPGQQRIYRERRSNTLLWTFHRTNGIFYAMSNGTSKSNRSEVLQGTLDLMVLKTLQALGPLHGFGIARRIEQLSNGVLQLNEGTVYTSLPRLQQQSWISSDWGTSENGRKANFYSITKRGMKQLARETEKWERISGVIGCVLSLEGPK